MGVRYTIDYNLKNGLGKPAISLYLTGCDKPIKCAGCHNYELQKESEDDYEINKIINKMEGKYLKSLEFNKDTSIVFLGGEPTAKYNIKIVYIISKYFKGKYPNTNTILYSWRTIEQIKNDINIDMMKYIDYGVLGAYDENNYVEKELPSSTNQYIYDFNIKDKLKPIKLKD